MSLWCMETDDCYLRPFISFFATLIKCCSSKLGLILKSKSKSRSDLIKLFHLLSLKSDNKLISIQCEYYYNDIL